MRQHPPASLDTAIRNVRGLMLAAVLKPEALQLLLGGTLGEANTYQSQAMGRLAEINARIARARKP